jgi:hypothetical protein
MFSDQPVETSQTQYVRLAGLSSLLAFTLNYHPHLFGNLLERAGALVKQSSAAKPPQGTNDA